MCICIDMYMYIHICILYLVLLILVNNFNKYEMNFIKLNNKNSLKYNSFITKDSVIG